MNVFILNTGRCGSTTFIKACEHITNFSCAHESLSTHVGSQRFNYPLQHIEADNRLSWLLGKLDMHYADTAFYVHLSRNKNKTIESFSKREAFGIMKAYKEGILLEGEKKHSADEIASDYIDTVESNIKLFLNNKSKKMNFKLESSSDDFKKFWDNIGAEGNLKNALAEWDINYNQS